ncbi:MAG: DUF6757 family protein [Halanaeroarchaeum sp.]
MQCHHCDRSADLTVEKDGVHVALCEEHFREQLESLADADALEDLRDQLNIDRA